EGEAQGHRAPRPDEIAHRILPFRRGSIPLVSRRARALGRSPKGRPRAFAAPCTRNLLAVASAKAQADLARACSRRGPLPRPTTPPMRFAALVCTLCAPLACGRTDFAPSRDRDTRGDLFALDECGSRSETRSEPHLKGLSESISVRVDFGRGAMS